MRRNLLYSYTHPNHPDLLLIYKPLSRYGQVEWLSYLKSYSSEVSFLSEVVAGTLVYAQDGVYGHMWPMEVERQRLLVARMPVDVVVALGRRMLGILWQAKPAYFTYTQPH